MSRSSREADARVRRRGAKALAESMKAATWKRQMLYESPCRTGALATGSNSGKELLQRNGRGGARAVLMPRRGPGAAGAPQPPRGPGGGREGPARQQQDLGRGTAAVKGSDNARPRAGSGSAEPGCWAGAGRGERRGRAAAAAAAAAAGGARCVCAARPRLITQRPRQEVVAAGGERGARGAAAPQERRCGARGRSGARRVRRGAVRGAGEQPRCGGGSRARARPLCLRFGGAAGGEGAGGGPCPRLEAGGSAALPGSVTVCVRSGRGGWRHFGG